jgi:hypothetical protein
MLASSKASEYPLSSMSAALFCRAYLDFKLVFSDRLALAILSSMNSFE